MSLAVISANCGVESPLGRAIGMQSTIVVPSVSYYVWYGTVNESLKLVVWAQLQYLRSLQVQEL